MFKLRRIPQKLFHCGRLYKSYVRWSTYTILTIPGSVCLYFIPVYSYGSTIYRCLVISSAPQVGVTSVLQRILNTLKQLGQSKSNFTWMGETKVCINGPGHMTKMATRAINSKNLKKSSSLEPVDRFQ